MSNRLRSALLVLPLLLAACSRDAATPQDSPDRTPSLIALVDQHGSPQAAIQRIEFTLETPERRGVLDLYRLVGDELVSLERIPFHHAPLKSFVRYDTPAAATNSVLLAHVSTLGDEPVHAPEYVCFARIPHTGNRHAVTLSCDAMSTITFFMAAVRIGRPDTSPFADAAERVPRWEALYGARDNDLIAFFISVFATIQNALLDMGRDRFNARNHSIRPVMESIVAQALDRYQRQGHLSAVELLEIADGVTGGTVPIARLGRFAEVYHGFAYVAPITLSDARGHLTRRDRSVDLPTLDAELQRFFVRGAPLEMADPRTHMPQGVRHERRSDGLFVQWQPLPHMDGYNVYRNGEYLRATRLPHVLLPTDTSGVLQIRAVGHGGEFDAQRHALDDAPVEEPRT
jgi:hypothetical protein